MPSLIWLLSAILLILSNKRLMDEIVFKACPQSRAPGVRRPRFDYV
jgi:hypothetical protein